MTSHDQTPFSAAPSALGYLYQCRYALLAALRRLREGTDFGVSLETLDDVVFQREGAPSELLQTKHSLKAAADLTDASPALWKTIRIWSEGMKTGSISSDSSLFLVTTASAAAGSAAAFLLVNGRDHAKALAKLVATATTSTNDQNAPAYRAFKELSDNQRVALVEAIYVFDTAPEITDLDELLRGELSFAARRDFLDSFLTRLEGWWLRRVIRHLARESGAAVDPIPAVDIEATIGDLREQFKLDSLPIDEDLLQEEVDLSNYQDRVFVHQLRLIDLGVKRLMIAVREYYRAFEQRSRWIREDLLLVGELDRYERRLVEEWQIHFERMREELGGVAADGAKKKAALALYRWVEAEADVPVRPNCTAPFVTRGSYHMLADRRHVGWHPDFLERLKALLEGGAMQA